MSRNRFESGCKQLTFHLAGAPEPIQPLEERRIQPWFDEEWALRVQHPLQRCLDQPGNRNSSAR